MTFKQQMEKAIKEYLTSIGFKYAPQVNLLSYQLENQNKTIYDTDTTLHFDEPIVHRLAT